MAVPASFPESNAVLDGPADMTVDECESLSVARLKLANGWPVVVSCWKLTRAELEEINRTGRMWLVVIGETMPPAYLDGTHPFTRKGGAG